jgi:hypothetical protein
VLLIAVSLVSIAGWTRTRPPAPVWGDVATWTTVVVTMGGLLLVRQQLVETREAEVKSTLEHREAMARSVSIDSEVVEVDGDDWIDDDHDWTFLQPSQEPEGYGGSVVPHLLQCKVRNDGEFPIFDVVLMLNQLDVYIDEEGGAVGSTYLPVPVLQKGAEKEFEHGPVWPRDAMFLADLANVDARVAFTDTWGKRWGRDRHHLIELHPDGGWMPLDFRKSLRSTGGVDADED